jgi:16S rRNA processing protein RimM
MQLVVGRVGRPHGLRGEVTVEVRTDDPEQRFADGAVLATDPANRGRRLCWRRGALGGVLVRFAGYEDADAVLDCVTTCSGSDSADLAPLVAQKIL